MSIRTRLQHAMLLLLACVVAQAAVAQKRYDPGASDTEIKLGQTMPYSGPLSAYAVIARAEAAYLRKINEEGGINGRKVTLISLDDAYNPAKTVEAVRRLIEQDEVLALFGSLGTPTNLAVRKYLQDRKVPLLFLSTGGSMWNDPKEHPWSMGFQPNYWDEGRVYALHTLQTQPDARIGLLYQNDDTGRDYAGGFKAGLGGRQRQIVAEIPYDTSVATLDSELLQLRSAGVQVLFDQTTPKFAAQVIRRMAEMNWKPVHYLNSISTSIGSVLTMAGLDNATGIISTMSIKDVTDPLLADDPGVKRWLDFMHRYYPTGNVIDALNSTGYTVAQAMVQVLRQCGDDLTRENLMRQAANLKDLQLDLLLPGVKVNTSPTNYAPLRAMRLRRFDGRQWVPFGELIGGP